MDHRVLLTRAAGRNEELSGKFSGLGVEVVICPLLALKPRPATDQDHGLASRLDRYDHIIFVSQTAVDHGVPLLAGHWSNWPGHLLWYGVGEATATRLRERDIESIVPRDSQSSAGLLALPTLTQVEGQRVLIVRGDTGLDMLRRTLEERGAQVDYLSVYERHALALPDSERTHIISLLPFVALIHSGETLAALANNFGSVRERIVVVVPSQRIAGIATESGFKAVVAPAADDGAMVETTMSILHDNEYWNGQ